MPQGHGARLADIRTDGGHQHETCRCLVRFQSVVLRYLHPLLADAHRSLPAVNGGFLRIGTGELQRHARLALADDTGLEIFAVALVAAINLRQVMVAALHGPDAVAVF